MLPRRVRLGVFGVVGAFAVVGRLEGWKGGGEALVLQVGLEIAERAAHVAEMERQQAAVAALVLRRGIEREEDVGDAPRVRKRLLPHVKALQIGQHPLDDGARLAGIEQIRREHRIVAQMVREDAAAIGLRQLHATREGIENHIVAPHEEVAGKAHALRRDTRAVPRRPCRRATA